MKEQLERDKRILDKAIILCNERGWYGLRDEIGVYDNELEDELKALNTKEQREFKNKDFHVKVWQDSEKIGIVTVWIREGFERYYDFSLDKQGIWFKRSMETWIYRNKKSLPNFGMDTLTCEVVKTPDMLSYSDIVTGLEKAHKLSSEVTIYDVIKECEGVTDKHKLRKILDKYERYDDEGNARQLGYKWLEIPYSFIQDFKVRLKDNE